MPLLYRAVPTHLLHRPDVEITHPWQQAHSWTYWMLQGLYARSGNSNQSPPNTSGVPTVIAPTTNAFWLGLGGFSADLGLVVGKGTNPDGALSYAMNDPYPSGSGAGELSYGEMKRWAGPFAPASAKVGWQREFTNLQPTAQIVSEQGLIGYDGTDFFLWAYDNLGAPFELTPGVPTTLQYVVTAQF